MRQPANYSKRGTRHKKANDCIQRENSMLTFEQSPFLGTANIVGKLFAKTDFTYSACSGAVVAGVDKQARELPSGQDFIIISAVSGARRRVDWVRH